MRRVYSLDARLVLVSNYVFYYSESITGYKGNADNLHAKTFIKKPHHLHSHNIMKLRAIKAFNIAVYHFIL